MYRRVVASLLVALAGCAGGDDVGEIATRAARLAPMVAPDSAPEPEPEPDMVAVDDLLAPYWSDTAAADAATAFAAGDWRSAREGFSRLAADGVTDDRRTRARLMIALCDARIGRHLVAADALVSLVLELPHLADFLRARAAREYEASGADDRALAIAGEIDRDSTYGMSARLLEGRILRQRRRWADVIVHYTRYLQDYPDGVARAEAEFRIAEAAERSGDTMGAIGGYRRLSIEHPSSPWSKAARKRIKALEKRLPRLERQRARTWTAADVLASATQDYRAHRNEKSAAEFARALDAPDLTPELACQASYYLADSWYKARKRDRAGPLFDAAFATCAGAGPEYVLKAAYQAGRSYAITGDWQTAAERFAIAEAVAVAQNSTLADDARVRQAEAREQLGEDDRATELLADTHLRYPDGDMGAEALWRLAWRAYRRHDYQGAVRWLREQIAAQPVEYNYWAEGQALYWLGRALDKLGDRNGANQAYRDAIERYPLTYYALLALNRLREREPDQFEVVVAKLAESPRGFAGAPRVRVRTDAVVQDVELARLVDLIRLGLDDEANAEMARLVDRDHVRGRAPTHEPAMWVVARHYHQLGRYDRSHWLTRRHALDYKRHWPVGHVRAKWLIAYPPGYRELIDDAAAEHGISPELLIAIVREESGFSPRLQSWANAIGLSQLLVPTARRFAGKHRINARTLRKPEVNLSVGAAFLAFLSQKWDGLPALIAPSYNAGEGAVGKWRSQRPWPLDAWIESIPADQARNYSKRVLSSYFAYVYLARGEIPPMPNDY